MKEELKEYFNRLCQLYKRKFNTYPTMQYIDNCNLFVSNPNEDEEAEWLPIQIEHIDLLCADKLNQELIEFYTSYYYMQLSRRI